VQKLRHDAARHSYKEHYGRADRYGNEAILGSSQTRQLPKKPDEPYACQASQAKAFKCKHSLTEGEWHVA
jgi:hypothetical protein